MKKSEMPILYSFRRCPYAIRARLALLVAQQTVVLREIVLRDKPKEFLNTSPSETVPCLVLKDEVIDESLDIMIWALKIKDPKNLEYIIFKLMASFICKIIRSIAAILF